MFPNPRWRKVLRDLWGNKTRTVLVVLSIAIGVAAIGVVAGTYSIITKDLPASYAQVNPVSASIDATGFDDSLVQSIRNLDQVEDAEGRASLIVRLKIGPDEWRDLVLYVVPDFNNIRINKFWSESGAWPPGEHALLVERSTIPNTHAKMGDTVLIQTPDGLQRELKIDGTVHDLNQPSGTFANQVNGYITFDTLEWLGYPRGFNELLITVRDNKLDRNHVTEVARVVEEKIQKSGRSVLATTIPQLGKHWFESYLAPMAYILGVLGVIVLLLSGFLVINTVSALLAQQERQIGIMKAIGARTGQVIWMYMVFVLILGGLALAIAIPIGELGTRLTVQLLSGIINFDVQTYSVPPQVLRIQIMLSLLVPLVAAIFPIFQSARITVREAVSDYGLTKANFGASGFDHLLGNVRGLSRPLMLSLRNTFRRKARLFLTLLTLMLGTGIFIAVLSVYASLIGTLNLALNYYKFDVAVFFNHPNRVEQIQGIVNGLPGVVTAETWGLANARLLNPNGTDSTSVVLLAPSANTQLIHPTLLAGRWLEPGDENALVINTDVVNDNPNIRVGNEVDLNIDGEKSTWRVVGIVRGVLIGPWAYANYPYFTRVTGNASMASAVYISTQQHDMAYQSQMAKMLEQQFESGGLRVSSVGKVADLRAAAIRQFNVVVIFLLIMALLLTIVGGLGLTGTMSLNVVERTREIGVMRAIGAPDGAVIQIVVVEGILIGILSWLGGFLLAFPLSNLLSDAVGNGFLHAPLSRTFSYQGAILWLGFMVILAVLASILPAWKAVRLTVRDVLAYE